MPQLQPQQQTGVPAPTMRRVLSVFPFINNLTVVLDFNKWQATDRSENVLQLSPLADKWHAFGWDAVEVDGHDIDEISSALVKRSDRPRAIIANTIKGKGISFMEDDNNWHYRIPTAEEVKRAFSELSLS